MRLLWILLIFLLWHLQHFCLWFWVQHEATESPSWAVQRGPRQAKWRPRKSESSWWDVYATTVLCTSFYTYFGRPLVLNKKPRVSRITRDKNLHVEGEGEGAVKIYFYYTVIHACKCQKLRTRFFPNTINFIKFKQIYHSNSPSKSIFSTKTRLFSFSSFCSNNLIKIENEKKIYILLNKENNVLNFIFSFY